MPVLHSTVGHVAIVNQTFQQALDFINKLLTFLPPRLAGNALKKTKRKASVIIVLLIIIIIIMDICKAPYLSESLFKHLEKEICY